MKALAALCRIGRENNGALALASYCSASILMTIVNKYILSSLHFRMNFFLLALQSVACVVFLWLFRSFGWLKCRDLHWPIAKTWFPVSLLLVAMIYTGSKSLQFLTVAMFTVFKNLTIVAIALGEQLLFKNEITRLMWISFGLIIASSIIGGYNDLSFNAAGYFWMIANCITSAAYVLRMRLTIKRVDFGDFDSVYYNNILGIPVMMAMSLLMENWHGFLHSFYLSSDAAATSVASAAAMAAVAAASNITAATTTGAPAGSPGGSGNLLLAILASGVAAFAISYSTAWSVRVSTSTSYSMVGALNKLPIALSGLVFFSNERMAVNAGYIFSVIIAFFSGILYSISQIKLRKQKAQTAGTYSKIGKTPHPAKGSSVANEAIEMTAIPKVSLHGSPPFKVNKG